MRVTITNTATGEAVRTCRGTGDQGMNRFQWALTGDSAPAAVAAAVVAAAAADEAADRSGASATGDVRTDALRGGGGGSAVAAVVAAAGVVVAAAACRPASTASR